MRLRRKEQQSNQNSASRSAPPLNGWNGCKISKGFVFTFNVYRYKISKILMIQLEEDVGQLIRLANNLKKSINTNYRTETLQAKFKYAHELYADVEQRLIEFEEEISLTNLNFLIKSSRQAYFEITEIIKRKIKVNDAKSGVINITTMATPKVDLKLGTALVQIYDGTSEHLTTFLDAVRLFHSNVEETFAGATPAQKNAAEATVVRFVRTRLTGKARQAVNENQTLNETLEAVKNHCMSKITAENLIAKLAAIKQTDNVTDFCEQVDKIIAQLKSVYLGDNIPEAIAQKMATKHGVDALIRGTKNNEARIVLKAGNFTNINDAIQKLQENAQSSPITGETSQNTTRIMWTSRDGARGRARAHQTQNNRGRCQQHNSGNFHQYNHGNFGHNRGSFRQSRGYQRYPHQRGGWSSRGNSFPNRGFPLSNHGMFIAQSANEGYQQQLPSFQQQIPPLVSPVNYQQPQRPLGVQSIQQHPLGVTFGQHTQ